MKFRSALKLAAQAIRENFLPGLLLQALMLAFLSLYVAHEGTRRFLGEVANFKGEAGFAFAFVSYIIAGALLPEVLRVAFFQGGRVTRRNVWLFLTAAPMWAVNGVVVDAFYRLQGVIFGTGSDFFTVLCKLLVDQFVYSPLIGVTMCVGWLYWRDQGFRASAWKRMLTTDFVWENLFPVQVAGWMIWIPGVALIYFMPSLLQIPVAVLIQVFWVLILTTVGERSGRQKT